MNKDAILATLIGFAIGLVITGILLVGPTLTKMFPKVKLPSITFSLSKQKAVSTPAAKATPTQFAVSIESPLAEAIEDNTNLLVSGTTSPGSTVFIGGSVDDTVAIAQADGKFAGKVTLTEGKNDITVTSYLKQKQSSQTVSVYYTPESL